MTVNDLSQKFPDVLTFVRVMNPTIIAIKPYHSILDSYYYKLLSFMPSTSLILFYLDAFIPRESNLLTSIIDFYSTIR